MSAVYEQRDVIGQSARRRGVAAVELAICLPVIVLILAGLWEVGRITAVQQVMWNSAREAARDASLSSSNLQTVANNLLVYLQGAEPSVFGKGHTTSMIAPVISLAASTYGYTCWDNTANQELFTITFTDLTNPTVTDPTLMAQLDRYEIVVSVPYTTVAWSPMRQITNTTRLSAFVDWAAMVDSPFQIAPNLPAQ